MRTARRLGLAALAAAIGLGVPASADERDLGDDEQPWLGISFDPQGFGAGVSITNVFDDTAASASGLRPGDELLQIDGEPASSLTLPMLVGRGGVGAKITMQVLRLVPALREDDAGYRVLTLRATLTAKPTDRELLRRQLVGKRAFAFSLVRPEDPTGDPLDDSVLNDKVGVLVWFAPSCTPCRGVVDRVADWGRRQSTDVATVAGTREDPASLAAYLRSNALDLPIGTDAEAYRQYTAVSSPGDVAVVTVVDRDGIVRLAIPSAAADDPALDDVFATAERLLERRKPRR